MLKLIYTALKRVVAIRDEFGACKRTLQIFLVIELGNLLAANSAWQYLGRVNVHLFLILHKNALINCISVSFSFSVNAE